ncbi:MAG TPA: ATP-binding protein [Thermoanaerobaculia bacterium]
MTETDDWQRANDAFLAAALTWLRLRLERLADWEPTPPAPSLPVEPAAPRSSSFAERFKWRPPFSEAAPPRPVLALPPASEAVTAEQIAEAASAMAAAEETDPPPALVVLARRFGLSRFERDVLLLCAALELDTRIAPLCARAQDDLARPWPTFALAMALFEEPAWDVLSPERPLRHWRLIEINQPGAQPLTTSALRADERIVNFLKGLNYLDDRLSPLLLPLGPPDGEIDLPPSQAAAVRAILRQLEGAQPGRRLPVFQLLGPDAPSKRLVAWHAAATLDLGLYRLPVEMMPTQVADLETLARLVQRESALAPFALYLDAQETEKAAPAEAPAPPLGRFLAGANGVFFVATQDVRPGLGDATVAVDVAKPTPAEQREAWAASLGENAGDLPARLASQFSLDLGALRRISRAVQAEEGLEAEGELGNRLWDAALASTRPRLEGLAQRLDPRATWDDLVLPARELDLLRQIAAQVRLRSRVYDDWGFAARRNRGLGISVLFAGESGTGKTMAAEVLANELRLSLYRIDLSTVVSKYIGETEKNLRRLFDAAEDGGAILFFDEADALFGKRSEVKDSHDRYANIEINYLLQRIESYKGLAILATNLKSALDTAFLRRLRFLLDFPQHGEPERREIWKRIFPQQTETDGLDFNRLARLSLNGGAINNVAMNAAFLAADAGAPVTMPHLLAAARTELLKLGRPINEADFRWTAPALVKT